MWMCLDQDRYVNLTQLATALGEEKCKILPFLHSISGRDITSFVFNVGKVNWLRHGFKRELCALSKLGETEQNVTDDMIKEATTLLTSTYGQPDDTIDEIRVQRFLTSQSMLLKMLPPTVGAFMQHLKRAAYATIVDRSSHEQHPTIPNPEEFGWMKDDSLMIPIM